MACMLLLSGAHWTHTEARDKVKQLCERLSIFALCSTCPFPADHIAVNGIFSHAPPKFVRCFSSAKTCFFEANRKCLGGQSRRDCVACYANGPQTEHPKRCRLFRCRLKCSTHKVCRPGVPDWWTASNQILFVCRSCNWCRFESRSSGLSLQLYVNSITTFRQFTRDTGFWGKLILNLKTAMSVSD